MMLPVAALRHFRLWRRVACPESLRNATFHSRQYFSVYMYVPCQMGGGRPPLPYPSSFCMHINDQLWRGLQSVKQWAYPTCHSGDPSSGSESSGFHPMIQEFQEMIENDPVLYMDFNLMFDQVPTTAPFNYSPNGAPQIRHYMDLLSLLNEVISQAPRYEDNIFIGFPINAALNWPMGTPAGLSTLTNEKVNAQFRKIFDVWATFLTSPASRYVLTSAEDGWFGPKAREGMPDFEDTFVCDPSAEYHGFASWDDFFTRRFRPGVRPVAAPDDASVVTSSCEATVYRIASGVREHDQFWLKGQPYSLRHMLAGDALAGAFAGGTVFQAYLSALSYHRWHAPVAGTVRSVVCVPGTYYAECPAMGFPDPDPVACCGSQVYLTAMATRAIVYIDADNKNIGLMCFMAVGMAEVSTCEVAVKEGQRVKKGDELGMFHFGGSTYCLIFRPECRIEFAEECKEDADIRLNSAIARISST